MILSKGLVDSVGCCVGPGATPVAVQAAGEDNGEPAEWSAGSTNWRYNSCQGGLECHRNERVEIGMQCENELALVVRVVFFFICLGRLGNLGREAGSESTPAIARRHPKTSLHVSTRTRPPCPALKSTNSHGNPPIFFPSALCRLFWNVMVPSRAPNRHPCIPVNPPQNQV